MKKATLKQVAALRKVGVDNYEVDGGVMTESMDDEALAALLVQEGSVAKAWAFHMATVDAQREAQAVHEVENDARFGGQEVAALVTAVATPDAPKPVAVALRGGPAVQALKMGPKPYRVTAPHNVLWWNAIVAELVARGGVANVAHIQEAVPGMPLTMLGYLLRRGHLAAHAE
jgi:hypothetical protein